MRPIQSVLVRDPLVLTQDSRSHSQLVPTDAEQGPCGAELQLNKALPSASKKVRGSGEAGVGTDSSAACNSEKKELSEGILVAFRTLESTPELDQVGLQ